jgi:hypothetical protein
MSDQDKDQGIKIVDKRRFSDDGIEREESSPSSSNGEKAAAQNVTGAAVAGSVERSAQAGKIQSSAKLEEPAASEGGQRRGGGSAAVNFNNFVLGLGTQALVLLGEIPNPETGLVSANLSAAKQTIDILGMLEEKTKGNLDENEATLLTEVLSSLRLAFVDRVNSKS